MERLSAYLKFVDNDYDGDAWHDVWCEDAENIASQFDNDEWEALTSKVVSMPPVAQEKCLYSIAGAQPINAFRIGLLLLHVEDRDVFYRALETMAECVEFMQPQEEDLAALKEFRQTILDTPAAERFYDAIEEKITTLSRESDQGS